MWYFRNACYLIVFVLQDIAKICMTVNNVGKRTSVSASELDMFTKISSGVRTFTERPVQVSDEFYLTDLNFKSTAILESDIAGTKNYLVQNTSLSLLKNCLTQDKKTSFRVHTSKMSNTMYGKTQTERNAASTRDPSTAVSSNKSLILLKNLNIMTADDSVKKASLFPGRENCSTYQSTSPDVTPKLNLSSVQTGEYATNSNFRSSSEDKIHNYTTTSVTRTAQAHSMRWLPDVTFLFSNITGSLLVSSGLITNSTAFPSYARFESNSELASSVRTEALPASSVRTEALPEFLMAGTANVSVSTSTINGSSLNVDRMDKLNLNGSIQFPTMATMLPFSEKFLSYVPSGNLITSDLVSTLTAENHTLVSDGAHFLSSSPLYSKQILASEKLSLLSTSTNDLLNITVPQPSAFAFYNTSDITNDRSEGSAVAGTGFSTRLIGMYSLAASPAGEDHAVTSALLNSSYVLPATEVTSNQSNLGTTDIFERLVTHSTSRTGSNVTRSQLTVNFSDNTSTTHFTGSVNSLQNVTISQEILVSDLTQTPYVLYNYSGVTEHTINVSVFNSTSNAQTTADFTSEMLTHFMQSKTEVFLNTTVLPFEMNGTSNASSFGLLDNYTDFTKSSVLEENTGPFTSSFSALPVPHSQSAVTSHTEPSVYIPAQHNITNAAVQHFSTFAISYAMPLELYNLSALPSVTNSALANINATNMVYHLNTVTEESVSDHSRAEAVTYGDFFSDPTSDNSQSPNVHYSQMSAMDLITGTSFDSVLNDEANMYSGMHTTDAMVTETDYLSLLNVTKADCDSIGSILFNSSTPNISSYTKGTAVESSAALYTSITILSSTLSPTYSSVMTTYSSVVTEGTDILYTVASKHNGTVSRLPAYLASSASSIEPLNSSLSVLSVTSVPFVNVSSALPGTSGIVVTSGAKTVTFLNGSFEITRLKDTATASNIYSTLQKSRDAGSFLSSPAQMYKSAKTTRSENEVSAFQQTSTDAGTTFRQTSTDAGYPVSRPLLAYDFTKTTRSKHEVTTLRTLSTRFSSPGKTFSTRLIPGPPTPPFPSLITEQISALASTSKHSKPLQSSASSKTGLSRSLSTSGIYSVTISSDLSYTSKLLYNSRLTAGRKSTMQGSTLYALPLLPLTFTLDGIEYSSSLANASSENYLRLEGQVELMLTRIFVSAFESAFMELKILGFKKGSVIVDSEIIFQSISQRPSSSDLVRVVILYASNNSSGFPWQIVPASVQSAGCNISNLEPEKVVISFTGIDMASSDPEKGTDPDVLTALQISVVNALMEAYPVQTFTILQIRRKNRNLEILGAAYLYTIARVSVNRVLTALYGLNQPIDLSTLAVNGASADVTATPVKFSITNRAYDERLSDHFSAYYQNFVGVLKAAVEPVLEEKYKNFMQLVIRNIIPGSVIPQGILIFLKPAPENTDVLKTLVGSLDSGLFLKGTNFLIDPLSVRIGDAKITDPDTRPGVPGYGVAIIVMCGLCILFLPFLILLYLRKGHFNRGKLYVSRRQHDIEHGGQLELDNHAYRQSLEQMQGSNDHAFLTCSTTSFVSKLQ